MAISDAVGLLFRIKADGSQGKKELSDFSKTVDKETKQAEDSFERFSESVENELDKIDNAAQNTFRGFAQNLGLSAEQTAVLSKGLPIAGAAIARHHGRGRCAVCARQKRI